MVQETKELVLKDIYARLLYGLHVRIYNHWTDSFEDEILTIDNISEILHNFPIEDIKPYLRQMSSITEEEQRMLDSMCNGVEMVSRLSGLKMFDKAFDWLNKNGFDYHGLIPMGLALEAKE